MKTAGGPKINLPLG